MPYTVSYRLFQLGHLNGGYWGLQGHARYEHETVVRHHAKFRRSVLNGCGDTIVIIIMPPDVRYDTIRYDTVDLRALKS